jgi:hypothetical protein
MTNLRPRMASVLRHNIGPYTPAQCHYIAAYAALALETKDTQAAWSALSKDERDDLDRIMALALTPLVQDVDFAAYGWASA